MAMLNRRLSFVGITRTVQPLSSSCRDWETKLNVEVKNIILYNLAGFAKSHSLHPGDRRINNWVGGFVAGLQPEKACTGSG